MGFLKSRRGARGYVVLGLLSVVATSPASASFHLWQISEIYSNADGSVQFIELFTTANSQSALFGRVLTANSDGAINQFVFSSNTSSLTANRRLLIATPGFAALPGAVVPDFTLAGAPFFDPEANFISIGFAGVDSVALSSSDLPADPTLSLDRSLTPGVNSPTNFAGNEGSLEAPAEIFADGFESGDTASWSTP